MQVSNETIEVLKNFAGINPNIVISPGQKLKTISEAKNIMAEADITEDFPQEFGIYDLNEFLSVLSLVDNPQLDFDENFVKVTNGGLNCYNTLECLQITFEHELIHALIQCMCQSESESITGKGNWKGDIDPYGGHSRVFMSILHNTFGHNDFRHNLFLDSLP